MRLRVLCVFIGRLKLVNVMIAFVASTVIFSPTILTPIGLHHLAVANRVVFTDVNEVVRLLVNDGSLKHIIPFSDV